MTKFCLLLSKVETGNVSQNDVSSVDNWSKSLGSIGQLFFYLFCFITILFLAYYCTKVLSKNSFVNRNNNIIKIIESISVGYQMSVHLINVGDKSILIGVSKEGITYLTDVDPDSIPEKDVDNKIPFESVIANYLKKNNKFSRKNNDD